MGTKNECFDHCKFMKTTTKSCKYQWKCKSCQNANVTKPWKGCKTANWDAGKKVKLRGVIAGGVTLFLILMFVWWLHPKKTLITMVWYSYIPIRKSIVASPKRVQTMGKTWAFFSGAASAIAARKIIKPNGWCSIATLEYQLVFPACCFPTHMTKPGINHSGLQPKKGKLVPIDAT